MLRHLSWVALIFAALAAVAFWNSEDESACNESRPVFGGRPCCQRHKLAGRCGAATLAALEETRRPAVTPQDLP